MRFFTKAAKQWQLLRLISVWGLTLLCMYGLAVNSEIRIAISNNRLTRQLFSTNSTGVFENHFPIKNLDIEFLQSSALPPPSSIPQSSRDYLSRLRFTPAKHGSFYKDSDKDIVSGVSRSDIVVEDNAGEKLGMEEFSEDNLKDRQMDNDNKSEFGNEDGGITSLRRRESYEDNGEKNIDKEENFHENAKNNEIGDTTQESDDEIEENDEETDQNSDVDDEIDEGGNDEETNESFEARELKTEVNQTQKLGRQHVWAQKRNEDIMRRWLESHLKYNGTRRWWEHPFRAQQLHINPEALGAYKVANWPWVTLEAGRYDPRLYTHPPGELPKQRLPQMIIFGAGKCGTRALIQFLMMHPNIAAARAEIHYFDVNIHKGLEWYHAKMPLSYSNQMTVEKSPSYLWEPRAPRELYKINKNVKLVLLVKDPVVRIMSQAARMDDADHRHELLFLRDEDGQKVVNDESHTVVAGLYVKHLEKWLEFFPISQMYVMEGMELIKEPFKEMKKLETFLELPPVLQESNFFLNKTRGFYCPFPFYSRKPECLSSAKGVPHPKLRPLAEKLIYDFYRPYNEKLFKIIGKRFNWEPVH